MKKQIKNNINQRKSFFQYEKKRLLLKSITQNLKLSNRTRWKLQKFFFNFPLKSSLTQIQNACILTGRTSSVYRFSKLSRLQLKKFVCNKLLGNVNKHSW